MNPDLHLQEVSMFTHALPQGSLRPFEALPPTLTPNAIFAMAPPAQRRLSFLGACLIYAGCGLAMTLAPSLSNGTNVGIKTNVDGFVVPPDPTNVIVELRPVPPPPPAHFPTLTLKNAPLRDPAWTPPTLSNVVPPTPTTLPTENHFTDSAQGGDFDSPNRVPAGSERTRGFDVAGPATTSIVDFDFRQMRILSKVAPVYPPMARMAKIQGEVVLLMAVDPRGIPTDVKALSGPHVSLEQEATRIARLWRFEPATLNGQAVAAQFKLTILFKLK